MVSLIQSNYRGMGSGMCPPGLGFCLQDRGELFDMTPGRPNSYAPGKRPLPHDHSRVRDKRWQTVLKFWRDGRRDSAARPMPKS